MTERVAAPHSGYSLLQGRRVISAASAIPALYATKMLADAGAEVIELLPADSEFDSRLGLGRPLGDFLRPGKRCVRMANVSELPERVLGAADLLICDEQTADDEIEILRNRFPQLNVVSVTPFGRRSIWSGRPANEFTLQALCGSTMSRGEPDGVPLAMGGEIGSWMGGAYTAVASLSALSAVQEGMAGHYVDVSLLAVMAIGGNGYASLKQSLGGDGWPIGHRTTELPSIEPTSDGRFVVLTTNSRQQFDDFLVMIERPDLLGDDELATRDGRQAQRREFTQVVREWTTKHRADEIVELASMMRIPVGEVSSPTEVVSLDHFVDRSTFLTNPTGRFVQPRVPYRTADIPFLPVAAPQAIDAGDALWLRSAGRTRPSPATPLSRIRMLDMTAWWAGPAAGQLLALLGADVIKIESARRPDGQRMSGITRVPPEHSWWESSYQYQMANLNKRGITLDLGDARGIELLLSLVGQSDLLVENYSPRVMDAFGLTWERLRQINPALIFVRMPAFGVEGPWRERVGFAQTMESISTMSFRTGFPDDVPVLPRGICDPIAGAHAAFAIMSALEHRRETGRGAMIEVPMIETALNTGAEAIVVASRCGSELHRLGNRSEAVCPQGVYRTAGTDEWIAISVTSQAEWEALCSLASFHHEWTHYDLEQRVRQADDIDLAIQRWASGTPAAELETALLNAGIRSARLVHPVDVIELPGFTGTGFVESINHVDLGRHRVMALPFSFDESGPPRVKRPAPRIGEHNREVLIDLLQLRDDELADLESAGVIGGWPGG